jgi:hypothetical protein
MTSTHSNGDELSLLTKYCRKYMATWVCSNFKEKEIEGVTNEGKDLIFHWVHLRIEILCMSFIVKSLSVDICLKI